MATTRPPSSDAPTSAQSESKSSRPASAGSTNPKSAKKNRSLQSVAISAGDLITAFVTLVVGVIVASILPWLSGRDLAMSVFRARESEREPDPVVLERIREQLDLPTNPVQGLWRFVTGIFRGDLGPSWVDPSKSAGEVAYAGFGPSCFLAASSTILGALIAWLIVWPRCRALAQGKSPKPGAVIVGAVFASLPEFVLGTLLLIVFGIELGWLPTSGWTDFAHTIMPVCALMIPVAGMLSRILLISIDQAAREPWVATWRINSVPSTVIVRALAKRGFATLAPQIVLFFAGILASTAFVEKIFNIPGMGNAALTAAISQDVPVIQALVLVVVTIGVVMGLISRVVHGWLLGPMLVGDDLSGTSAQFGSDPAVGTTSRVVRIVQKTGVAILVGLIIVAVVWGLLRDSSIHPDLRLESPSAAHPLGTDQLGRDVLARLADGTASTILLAILLTFICAVVGLLLGISGRWAAVVGDALNAFPAVFAGLMIAAIFGPSTWTASVAVILVGWIPLAAHASTQTTEAKASGHYQWAKDAGASSSRLMFVHVLPFVATAVFRHGATRIGHNIIALAGLGFLGLGQEHDSPQWGVMLNESSSYAERAPWFALTPTIALILVGVATTLLADALARRRG